MSILLNPHSLRSRSTPKRSTLWFAVYVFASLIGGALLAGLLLPGPLAAGSGFWHDFIQDHGPDRILRRIQTICAVVLAPWMLKKIGWEGFQDLGWQSSKSREARKADFWRWFLIGTLAMAGIFVTSLLSEIRVLNPFSAGRFFSSLVSGFLFTGLAVGILEETLTRGVLYRTLARTWTPWTAALVTSLIFAWAHFMKATPESFENGYFAIIHSSLFADFAKPTVPLKFLNMFAFGVVLCRLVQAHGDIWAAAGLHAAAVGCIKVFSKMTEFNPDTGYQSWIGGHSSKFDDGWLLFFVLLAMLCLLEWKRRNSAYSSRVHF
ncbi:MAG: CPBP family intramembrane glutamic endopeptidase [Kiritimatiellia bacterium]